MTNKFPLGATLSQTCRFVYRDFFRILGVSAIPLGIMWIPSLLFRPQMTDLSAQLAARDFSAMRPMLAILVPLYIAMLVLMTMQMIGIARLALGLQRGWFYFSLGKPVWRLLGSMLLLAIMALLGYAVALFGSILLGVMLGLIAKAVNITAVSWLTGAIVVVGAVALYAAYIYCLVRVAFLLCPVIAAEEEGFALRESWRLGRGNFWRMFAIILVVLVPVMAIELWLVFAYMFKGLPFPPPHASAAQRAAFNTALHERTIAMTNGMFHYWYIAFPAMIAFCVVFYGFSIGAQCFAYRALKAGSAPVPGDALP